MIILPWDLTFVEFCRFLAPLRPSGWHHHSRSVAFLRPFGRADGIIIAGQCSKGRKLGCTVPHRHPRMMLWLVMWQIDDIVVMIHYALCPPICLLRSLAVAPSSKFRPRRMAFLPKRFLILNCASCILRSLSSLACSSCCCFSNAS